MSHRIRTHLKHNVIGYVALFFSLSLGTAWALGTNSVKSKHIKDGQVRSADVANDSTPHALTGQDIAEGSLGGLDVTDGSLGSPEFPNNALNGGDIDESSLGTVPVAAQGGTGRYAFQGSCDPNTVTYVDCAFVSVLLDRAGRVFVSAQVQALPQSIACCRVVSGACRLEVDGSSIEASETIFHYYWNGDEIGPEREHGTLTAVTDPLPPGNHVVGVECYEAEQGAIKYPSARVTAVGLSAN
ncbi:MAG: hypothetical protein M3355_07085 [Actinomycetota bacterium]|nr:hypothetical protein [Actinomycetota bacterium]